jgi:hypothetical protein
MRRFPEFCCQRRRHVFFGEEDARPAGPFRGELLPALRDLDDTIGVLAVGPLNEQFLDFGLAAVREEIQRRGTGLDTFGQLLDTLLLVRGNHLLFSLQHGTPGNISRLFVVVFEAGHARLDFGGVAHSRRRDVVGVRLLGFEFVDALLEAVDGCD